MKKFYFLLIALLCSATMLSAATLTVKANNDAWGTVTGGGEYCGEVVTITATPNEGYCFVGWFDEEGKPKVSEGGVVTGEIAHPFFYCADDTYIAKFAEVVTLTLNVETPGGLSDAIFDAGKRPVEVTKLTLTGTLNDDDFTLMRETMTSLLEVDLSGITNTTGVNFRNHSNLQSIILPLRLTTIEGADEFNLDYRGGNFSNCSSLTSIIIPNSVTSIGDGAFLECSSLISVEIPNSVIVIGNEAFRACSSLSSIEIPNSVTAIRSSVFYLCSSLTSITIPNSVTSIGEHAFRACSSLSSIEIPNSVTSIGFCAFDECYRLTSIKIPNSVTWIASYAFGSCYDLKTVTLGNGLETIHYNAFEDSYNIDTIICVSANTPKVADCTSCTQQSFSTIDPQTCVLKVPAVAYDSYVRHSIWGAFLNIETMDIDYYNIQATANNSEMGEVKGAKYYLPNETVTLEAVAYSGYKFVKWSDGSTENPRTFTATADVSLTAEFAVRLYEVTLTCNEAQGTVTGGGEYEPGTQVTITATANEGYKFSHWVRWYEYENEEGGYWEFFMEENPYIFEMDSQFYDIQAVFVEVEEFEVDILTDGNGYLIGAGGWGIYSYGEEVTVEAIANEGYHFVEWSDGSMENPRTIVVTADIQLVAAFAKNQYEVNVSADENGYVIGGGIYYYGEEVIIEAIANKGYHFVKWSDDNTENPRTIVVSEDVELSAEFAKEGAPEEDVDSRIFIAESADETQGTVKVMIVAEAIEGFEFSHWSDGNTENPRIVSLDADVELYAYFKASTDVENSRITSAVVYSNNGVLYVDGAEADYHVLDAAGRLVYSGSDAALALPRGVYVVVVGDEVEKVVL